MFPEFYILVSPKNYGVKSLKTGFFIEKVHKNNYGASFWFEGRFLEDLNIGSGEITFDPDADFGLRVQKLTG